MRAGRPRASWPAGARVLSLEWLHSSTMADLNNLFGDLQGKGHIHVNCSVSSGQGASAAVPAALRQFERHSDFEQEMSEMTKRAHLANPVAKRQMNRQSKKKKKMKKGKVDKTAGLKQCGECAEFKSRDCFSQGQWNGDVHEPGRRYNGCPGFTSTDTRKTTNQQARSVAGKRNHARAKRKRKPGSSSYGNWRFSSSNFSQSNKFSMFSRKKAKKRTRKEPSSLFYYQCHWYPEDFDVSSDIESDDEYFDDYEDEETRYLRTLFLETLRSAGPTWPARRCPLPCRPSLLERDERRVHSSSICHLFRPRIQGRSHYWYEWSNAEDLQGLPRREIERFFLHATVEQTGRMPPM